MLLLEGIMASHSLLCIDLFFFPRIQLSLTGYACDGMALNYIYVCVSVEILNLICNLVEMQSWVCISQSVVCDQWSITPFGSMYWK